MATVAEALAEFKAAIRGLGDQSMLDRFYYGRPAIMLAEGQDPELRRVVAEHLNVPMRDVLITGSAKIGFTTVAKKDRPIFSAFGDTSDIDVAVISKPLFEDFWKRTVEFSAEDAEWRDGNSFRKYLAQGWIRPDKLPASESFTARLKWFEFFQKLKESGRFGNYKINSGVYYDEYFWEQYACRALAQCRHNVENVL